MTENNNQYNPGIWAFFKDGAGRRAYNICCLECDRDCKQSHRVTDIYCPYREMKKKELRAERRKKKV